MNFHYINSKGERVNFYEAPYFFQSGDLLDYSWSYDSESGFNLISNVRKEPKERKVSIGIIPDTRLSYEERKAAAKSAADRLFDVVEYDVLNDVDGSLFTDSGFYLPCRLMSSSKSNWESGLPFIFEEFSVVSAKNSWIREVSKSFYPSAASGSASEYLDYDFDYNFDYSAAAVGVERWNIQHIAPMPFKLTVYGPAVQPRISINGHIYQVFTSLAADEYLVIDSLGNTVDKHMANGAQLSMYDLRGKSESTFVPIEPGNIALQWDGTFGFDLELRIERSEPKWSSS